MFKSKSHDSLALLATYTIGIEAIWQKISTDVAARNAVTADKIEKLIVAFQAQQSDVCARWRAAYLCEQLIGQVLPLEILIAEGDRRLFEAKSLGLKSTDDIASRWAAEKTAAQPNDQLLAAIYGTLMDDIHWLYDKRSLDRQTRSTIGGQIFVRAIITLALCLLPFLIIVCTRMAGPDLMAKVPQDFRTSLVGGYAAISFGALGALFSRLITFQARYSSIDYDEAASTFVGRTLNLRQAVGAIGSLIFFFAIFGALVGGKLFPVLENLLKFSPPSWLNEELAKLVVWSFLAGFSERLVPDFLTRTESTAASASRPNA